MYPILHIFLPPHSTQRVIIQQQRIETDPPNFGPIISRHFSFRLFDSKRPYLTYDISDRLTCFYIVPRHIFRSERSICNETRAQRQDRRFGNFTLERKRQLHLPHNADYYISDERADELGHCVRILAVRFAIICEGVFGQIDVSTQNLETIAVIDQ